MSRTHFTGVSSVHIKFDIGKCDSTVWWVRFGYCFQSLQVSNLSWTTLHILTWKPISWPSLPHTDPASVSTNPKKSLPLLLSLLPFSNFGQALTCVQWEKREAAFALVQPMHTYMSASYQAWWEQLWLTSGEIKTHLRVVSESSKEEVSTTLSSVFRSRF